MSTITQMTNWEAADDIAEGSSHGDVPNRMWCVDEMYWHRKRSVSKMATHVRELNGNVALFCGDHRHKDVKQGRTVAWV